ncbi:RHS repeat-associated core domain-containing protein [Prevotella sp. P6B4]|uniref:RHS repeat-associated core domain-containing protein n=1 Tax=Prevotella sp. P6B4 TaxID=1410614 RepID=UPI00048D2E69|nr:RHS repeat-associated core domain-containing protein [Prevotella sp. P6B4]
MKNSKVDKYLFDGGYAQASVADFQPYKYNGKELDHVHGLNWYDYGARLYDPILLRWDRMDPLCEKFYPFSPYNYCGNSPIKNIDPDGRIWTNIAGGIIGAVTDYVCQVTANVAASGGFSTDCLTDIDEKAIALSAVAGFISSGASAVETAAGRAIVTRTGSKIAGKIAGKVVAEGTRYAADVVANGGDLANATIDYTVGKTVKAFDRKTVHPTSNKKAVKAATERAENSGRSLSIEQKNVIRRKNAMDKKNAAKKNKSIERGNAVKNKTAEIMYNSYQYYDKK